MGYLPKAKKRQPLAEAEAIAAAALVSHGHSVDHIAHELSLSPDAIRSSLTKALNTLQTGADQFAQDWLIASSVASRRGYHQPAKDALQALKVIDPPKPAIDPEEQARKTPTVVVQLGFALPGLPTPQAITATAEPSDE